MKTPMQELIMELGLNNTMIYSKLWLESFVEKEKQMVIDTYDKGISKGMDFAENRYADGSDGENYYNETFKK